VLVLYVGSATPRITGNALTMARVSVTVPGGLQVVQRKPFARGTFPDCSALAAVEAKPSVHNAPQEMPGEET